MMFFVSELEVCEGKKTEYHLDLPHLMICYVETQKYFLLKVCICCNREGAGDCSSCVAVMIELARGVSHWAHGMKRSIIFLFNTGEEEGLNGAHSFITQVWNDLLT